MKSMRRSNSCVVMIAVWLLAAGGCGSDDEAAPGSGAPGPGAAASSDKIRGDATAFCGGCHNPPRPETFPKDAWYEVVDQGFRLFYESERRDLKPPSMNATVAWYRSEAPDRLSLTPAPSTPSPSLFRRQPVAFPGAGSDGKSAVGVAHLLGRSPAASGEVLLCDMSAGDVARIELVDGQPRVTTLVKLKHPAHVERCDLNGDGRSELLVSVLGSFLPQDHFHGELVWLDSAGDGAASGWKATVLMKDIGRVADAQAADFDGDGDLDLVVAEFGWRKTGSIHLLRQTGRKDGIPQFEARVIDPRHGTIHVPVADLDGDGDQDFVALVSQEFEQIDAFLNRGDGTFERQQLHLSGDPAYGSSGIQLADLDGDRDLDVLYTNGDTLDTKLVKDYHSVQWLENEGDFPFMHHQIGRLPGVYRAVAGDMDGDGDTDVVAGAWIPPENSVASPAEDKLFDTLVWYEHRDGRAFEPHSLMREASLGHMTIDLADPDRDGDLDVVAGRFSTDALAQDRWFDIHWNEGRAAAAAPSGSPASR